MDFRKKLNQYGIFDMSKKIVKKILSKKGYAILVEIKSMIKCILIFGIDCVRYFRHAHMAKANLNQKQLSSKLIASSHVIEKGMSLPSPRLGYGKKMLLSIIDCLSLYRSNNYDQSDFSYTNSVAVIKAYYEYHAKNGYDLKEIGDDIIAATVGAEIVDAGITTFSRTEYLRLAKGDFHDCALSRYSVRAFSGESVPENSVQNAMTVARKTPSVCNRQSWHVYWVKSENARHRLAELQNGHRGFGDQVDSFLVITTDLHSFFGIGERNQCYVDGGLYAMSLLYALHYEGIGACPLNWCMTPSIDKKLRHEVDIPSNENIIMIIAIGMVPGNVRVAKSIRKPVEKTLLFR